LKLDVYWCGGIGTNLRKKFPSVTLKTLFTYLHVIQYKKRKNNDPHLQNARIEFDKKPAKIQVKVQSDG